jgi:predicted O-methyltransferase YrrM
MSQQLWSEVDSYVERQVVGEDAVLAAARQASEDAGLPEINVAPNQGKLLMLLAQIQGARHILEIGTLGAYSTIWLARALPADGELVTLELNPQYAELASANVERAGLGHLIKIKVGQARDSLRALIAEHTDPFDLVFIDADKQSTPEYFELALELVRAGSVIVTDNVVRGGALIDPDSTDPGPLGMRRFHELLAASTRVSATTVQTVGSKGYDGFTLALVER